jgi:hypothetical protein
MGALKRFISITSKQHPKQHVRVYALMPCYRYIPYTLSEYQQGKVISKNRNPKTDPDQSLVYQIRIEGQLGSQWTDWFEGLAITLEDNGDTLLTGPVIDQSALHGLLKKLRDLGMPLLSVNRIEPWQTDVLEGKL